MISKLENWTFLYCIYLQRHLLLKWKELKHRGFNILKNKACAYNIQGMEQEYQDWDMCSILVILQIEGNIFHSVSEIFVNVLGPLFCCWICWQIIIGSLYWNAPCKLRILCVGFHDNHSGRLNMPRNWEPGLPRSR